MAVGIVVIAVHVPDCIHIMVGSVMVGSVGSRPPSAVHSR
jgi:hypothetical protein